MYMSKIRQYSIKEGAKRIFREYSGVITTDFDINKEILNDLGVTDNKTFRNRLAGYLVTLKKNEYRVIIPPKKVKKVRSKKDKIKKQRKRWVG